MFRGRKCANGFSYTGESTLAQLVACFGYVADHRLRQDTIGRVVSQLDRAEGIKLTVESQQRDSAFWLTLSRTPAQTASAVETAQIVPVVIPTMLALPEPFWPHALGLDRATASCSSCARWWTRNRSPVC